MRIIGAFILSFLFSTKVLSVEVRDILGYELNSFGGFALTTPILDQIFGQEFTFPPDRVNSQGSTEYTSWNSDRFEYSGPGGHFALSYGPYMDGAQGKTIEAFIVFATPPAFNPTTYQTCRKRKYWPYNNCISWDTHTNNHGYYLDLTADNGQRVLTAQTVTRDHGNLVDSQKHKFDGDDQEYTRTISLTYNLAPNETLNGIEFRTWNPFGVHSVTVQIKAVVIRVYKNR